MLEWRHGWNLCAEHRACAVVYMDDRQPTLESMAAPALRQVIEFPIPKYLLLPIHVVMPVVSTASGRA